MVTEWGLWSVIASSTNDSEGAIPSVEDEQRSGRASTCNTEENLQKMSKNRL